MGFGHSRDEAEETFGLDFVMCWDQIAMEEDDGKLSSGAKAQKQALLELAKLEAH